MNSDLPKFSKVNDKSMLNIIIETSEIKSNKIIVVVGYKKKW